MHSIPVNPHHLLLTEVVVVLLGELLGAEPVHLGHLQGQVLRVLETLRVQDHLSDEA